MDKIDNLDRKILSILSKNARIPFKDVDRKSTRLNSSHL